MKILIVSQYFWPENFRVNDLSIGLARRGHRVSVLTGIPNYPNGEFYPGYNFFKNIRQDYFGVKIIRVPLVPRGKSGNLSLILNYLSFVIFGSFFAPFVCRDDYDLIFVYGLSPIFMAIPAILLKKLHKKPLILYVLDLWPDSISAVEAIKSDFLLTITAKIVHYIYRQCDQILVSSPGFKERIKEVGIEESLVNYWPQWAEDIYQVVPAEKKLPENQKLPSGFCIMFAGNIGAAQGFKTIIEAADKLKKYSFIHWIIIGDGRMKPWVEREIQLRKLGNIVHLLGKRPLETMPNYFVLADALLISLKRNPIFALTLPAKIQSYMASGRPILGCLDGEGSRIIKESGAGLSSPADDCDSLAKNVLKLYNLSNEERQEMGVRGRMYFEKHFTRDNLLSKFENRAVSLVKKNNKSP